MTHRPALFWSAILVLMFPLALASQSVSSAHPPAASATPARGCLAIAPVLGAAGPRSADQSASGFDLANLDRTASPCSDFFAFADGGWVKNNPIPADHPLLDAFKKLQDHNDEVLHQIVEEAAHDKSAAPGSNWQKIGDLYASCMDQQQVEAAGLKPLEPELQLIAGIKDAAGVQAELTHLYTEAISAAFSFGSEPNPKDSTQMIAALGQGGLALPDRQYYLDQDDQSKKTRADFVVHVANVFNLMGDDAQTASAKAAAVLRLQTRLAQASMSLEDLRDPQKTFHPMSVSQLDELTPHFSWAAFLRAVGAPPVASLDVNQPDFIKELGAVIGSVPVEDWKADLTFELIDGFSDELPSKFQNEAFDFSRAFLGAKSLPPRWKQCTDEVSGTLGEPLAEFFVQRTFPPQAKTKALAVVQNLIAALRDDLATLDWMSPATRKQALQKLDKITLKVGYPDKWRDYSTLKIDRGPLAANTLRWAKFELIYAFAKIGKPVDRSTWDGLTPQTVNAEYRPDKNDIIVTAGILQPPFFNLSADDALNYGGIGAVIGHEITHGFDDQGAQYDGDGNLRNWWTPEDLKNFQERGDCLAKQFDAYEVEPGLHSNGKLEEGEAIADLGGLTISHAAFEKTLEGKPALQPIDGFTAEQRFFLGWAQVWTGKYTPEFGRLLVKTDPHPLDQLRVNGPLSNLPAFAKAWGCNADSKMVRPDSLRCRIW